MNKFRQHLPAFVDGDPFEFEFATKEDLFNHPNIKKWTESPKFTCFAKSDNCLMAVFNNNKEWWVVGYILEGDIDLPIWDEMPKLKNE